MATPPRLLPSCSGQRGRKEKFPDEFPSFCLKIVTNDDLRDGKELPEAAVRKYRNCMADHLFLEVPNCERPWKLELRRSTRGGRIWLNKGWQEFANFYSLDEGCVAVFSYEGECSHFQVRILQWNDMELDYPIYGGGTPKRKKPEANQNMLPAHLKVRATSISTGSSADENQNDLPAATSFKSNKPYFIINMTASYIDNSFVYINRSFAKEHLCRPGTSWDVTLQIPDDKRVWTAVCTTTKNKYKCIYTRFSGAGWKAFKQDNHLVKGVICAFVLIEERTFRVSIFRTELKINRHTEEMVLETEYSIHAGRNDGTPKVKNQGATQDMHPAHYSVPSGSSADEDQNILTTATIFKSDKPIFMLNMTATYMRLSLAYISASFATEHLCQPGTSCNVILQNSDEKVWTAQCFVSEHSNHRVQASISGTGWKAFKEDNHLVLGNVCVFELIGELKLRVSIFQGKVKIIRLKEENEANLISWLN
ncbi:B3 domain-containing protein Os03g0620400-like [Argentina anserina]|uniref:B3 domain-containing protein Os03g0620400-like n=1 Tax=Argentina anserina TaxID=57926 RepID=UPI0021763C13|nr:B3 domain-containing protein Os03g0620400-like [Potentilla anserina]